ncbi:MAG: ATP-binding protein [Bacteroidales bacterium]|nr:ATP-binding protein [Bacteroidales bacterium]
MLKTKKIVLTGPESTGKSTLAKQLAKFYNVPCVAELARNFIADLDRAYTEDDVLEIARLQIAEEERMLNSNHSAVFFDTDLVITKIWLLHVYGKSPSWIDEALNKYPADLHLLCNYDLPWEPDPVRENPDIRPLLFEKYKNEIISLNQPYSIIIGVGEERISNAITTIKTFIGF